MNAMKRLEIGPRDKPLGRGWTTLDVVKRPSVNVVADWARPPLPFKAESFDLIYASHVLEHIPWFATQKVLREALRILRRKGSIEIWVPDFTVIVSGFLDHECKDPWRKFNKGGDYMTWVNGRLFSYGPRENWHRATFTEQSLRRHLQDAGFTQIKRLKKPRGYHHGPINLGLSGRKP